MTKDRDEIIMIQKPEEKKRRGVWLLTPLVLIVCVGLLTMVYYALIPGGLWYDQASLSVGYVDKTEDNIVSDLNRTVNDDVINISIASTIIFHEGDGPGEACIDNTASIKHNQKVTIVLDEGNETIYESDAIAPGAYVQSIHLNRDLDPGTYAATALFTQYDCNTHEEQGSAAAQIDLVVLA